MKRKEFLGLSGMMLAGAALPGGRLFGDEIKDAASGPAKLDARIFEVKMQYAWTLSRGTWNVRQNVLLRLEKDGVAGMGESAPIARYNESAESGMAFLEKARPILDRDLWQYVDRWNEIDALTPGEHAIKAALDMAILDWVSRKLGVPLYKFLGLDKAKTPVTTYSIGIDEVKVMQEKIRAYPDFGYYKIKLGTPNDKAIIEGIREVTDKPLRPDANEGWKTKEEALAMIDWMADKGVELVEQPMPAGMFEEYKWLKERSKLPIFADESMMTARDIPRLVRRLPRHQHQAHEVRRHPGGPPDDRHRPGPGPQDHDRLHDRDLRGHHGRGLHRAARSITPTSTGTCSSRTTRSRDSRGTRTG